jgi:hypothetical protein
MNGFGVRSSRGRGWIVTHNGTPVSECEKFDYRGDAQSYADLRNRGADHTYAWNEVYREGKGGQAGDQSMGR